MEMGKAGFPTLCKLVSEIFADFGLLYASTLHVQVGFLFWAYVI